MALKEYTTQARETGLAFDYANVGKLERLVSRALVRIVRERFDVPGELVTAVVRSAPEAALRARVEQGYDSRGHKTSSSWSTTWGWARQMRCRSRSIR